MLCSRKKGWVTIRAAYHEVLDARPGRHLGTLLSLPLISRPGARTISLLERFPGERAWQQGVVREDPATDDEVVWRVEFEQKEFAGTQGSEGPAAGRPEVQFLGSGNGAAARTSRGP